MEEFTKITGTISSCSELVEGLWFSVDTYLRTDTAGYNEDVQSLYMMKPKGNVDWYFMVAIYRDGLFPKVLMNSEEFTEEQVKGKWAVMSSFQSYQLGAHFRLIAATNTAEEGFQHCAELLTKFESCVNLHNVLMKCEELDILPLTIQLKY